MSSLFDRLEDQLRAAADAQIAARAGVEPAADGRRASGGRRGGDGRGAAAARRLRGWLTTGGRMLPVGLALASTVAVVVAALVLLHPGTRNAARPPAGGGGSSLPDPFSPRARREGHELSRLLGPVQHSAVCAVRASNGPKGPTGRPGQALLDEFAVLRRPYRPLRFEKGGAVDLGLSGVDPYPERDWRLGRVSDGATFIVVPVRVRPGAGQPGPRCLDAQARALRRDARRIPASIRAQTVYLGERELAFARRLITRPPYDSVCLMETGRNSAGADCGSRTLRALRRPSLPQLTSGGPLRRAAYLGVVPNGVASVTIRVPKRSGHSALALRGTVVGNVVVVPASIPLQRAGFLPGLTIVWRNAAGQVIDRVTAPAGGSHAYCLAHRLECLALLTTTTSGSGTSGSGSATATTMTGTATSAPGHTTTTHG